MTFAKKYVSFRKSCIFAKDCSIIDYYVMAAKSRKIEWESALSLKSRYELQYIIDHPEGYTPEFLKMAKEKLAEFADMPDNEAMKVVLKRCLQEMGCPCEENDDGDLEIWFQGTQFLLILSPDNHYIEIMDYCWIKADLDDAEEVDRLKQAINKANTDGDITTVYFIDEKYNAMGAYCSTNILYRPMILDIKKYLQIRLSNFFLAHDIIHAEMVLLKERASQQKQALIDMSPDKLPVC